MKLTKKGWLVCFIALLITSAASAQIEKGTVLAGASSNFAFNSTSQAHGSSTTTLNLDLRGGYFIINNLALGIQVDYYQNWSSASSGSYGSTSVGLFGRYYYKGKIFGGLGITEVSPYPSGGSYNLVPIQVGYAAFINKNIAIEPSLSLTEGNSQSVLGLNVGFTLYLHRK
jgi:hypothetical protein